MDLQFHGANCVSISYKGTRLVVDDNLVELGAKSVIKGEDIALFTGPHSGPELGRLVFDSPGEYEVADISIIGLKARLHIDTDNQLRSTMFKLITGEMSVLVSGHVYPELNEGQLETIGTVDVLIVPVGGNGYTLDSIGALKLIKAIEPRLIIPTHYADKELKFPVPQQDLTSALKELAMEPKESVLKLRLKPTDLSDLSQLIVLEKS